MAPPSHLLFRFRLADFSAALKSLMSAKSRSRHGAGKLEARWKSQALRKKIQVELLATNQARSSPSMRAFARASSAVMEAEVPSADGAELARANSAWSPVDIFRPQPLLGLRAHG